MIPAILLITLMMSLSGGFGKLISYCWEEDCRSILPMMLMGAATIVVVCAEPMGHALVFVASGGTTGVLA
jgi:hypothetical protein